MKSSAGKEDEQADARPMQSGGAASRAAHLVVKVGGSLTMTGGHSDLWNRAGFLVRRLHQIHVAMFMEDLGTEQVTPIQYGLMSVLVAMPGLDQLSLAAELGIDRANVAEVLKRLEARKLVLRIVDPHNRRRKICLPTRSGEAFVQKYRVQMQRAQERLIEPLSAREKVIFVSLLKKLVDANNVYGRAALRQSRPVRQGGRLPAQ